jgi:hypothetical protein
LEEAEKERDLAGGGWKPTLGEDVQPWDILGSTVGPLWDSSKPLAELQSQEYTHMHAHMHARTLVSGFGDVAMWADQAHSAGTNPLSERLQSAGPEFSNI